MILLPVYVLGLLQANQTPPAAEAVRRAIAHNQTSYAAQEITALGPEAVPWLIRALPRLEQPTLFRSVASELRRRNAMASIPTLIQCLGNPTLDGQLKRAAGDAIQEWGWTACNDLIRGSRSRNHDLATACAELLANLAHFRPADRRMKPTFFEWSKRPDSGFRVAAVHGLWNLAQWTQQWSMDGVYVIHILDHEALRRVIDLSQDADAGVRAAALSRLSLILWSRDRSLPEGYLDRWESPTTEAFEWRARPLLKDKDPVVRAAAVAVVSFRGWLDRPNYDALRDVDELVRHTALLTAKVVGGGWVDSLSLLAKSPRPEVRRAAAELLGRSLSSAADRDLLNLLRDPDSQVRARAREALRHIRGDPLLSQR